MNEDANGGTVSLSADVNEFENGLDRANAFVSGWTAKVESKFASMAAAVSSKSAGLVNSLASFADKGGEEIGGALGGKIGMAAGMALGGPVGALIGSKLGELGGAELAKSIDFETITQGLNELAQGVQPITDKFKSNWAEVRGDASDTFDRIKELAKGLDIKGLLKGEAGAWDDFTAKAQQAFDEISGFGDRLAFKFEETIDTIWNSVQAPLAAVADWLQSLLEGLGLVDQGTQSWGESLSQIQNVGEQVFGGIGYGLGYLEGLFKQAGGLVLEYYGVPLQKMYAIVMEGYGIFIRGLNQLSEDAGLGKFKWATALEEKLDKISMKLKNTAADTLKYAQELQATDPEAQAKKREQAFINAGKSGKDQVEEQRWQAQQIAMENAIEEALQGPANTIDGAADKFDKATSALVMGRRESTNAIIQAQNAQTARAAAGANPADPAKAAAEKTEKNTKDAAVTLEEIADMFRDSPVIMAV
ncbi:hypothetical protein BH11PLA2_BH11PLA2_32410 [soil metagenome]